MATRWGYRISEVADMTGLSRSTIDKHAQEHGIPRRKIGNAVVLQADAVERVFAFESDEAAPSADALALVRGLMA